MRRSAEGRSVAGGPLARSQSARAACEALFVSTTNNRLAGNYAKVWLVFYEARGNSAIGEREIYSSGKLAEILLRTIIGFIANTAEHHSRLLLLPTPYYHPSSSKFSGNSLLTAMTYEYLHHVISIPYHLEIFKSLIWNFIYTILHKELCFS